MRDTFIAAIRSMNKLVVGFYSKEDGRLLQRTCAPMDYGPSRRAKEKYDRFHFWDYDSDTGAHVLSLPPDQMVSLEKLVERFDPAEFISWQPQWLVTRDWGTFS